MGPIPGDLTPSNGIKLVEAWLDDTTGATNLGPVSRLPLAKLDDLVGGQFGPLESMVRDALGDCHYIEMARTEEGWLVPRRIWSLHRPSPLIRAAVQDPEALEILGLCFDERSNDGWLARTLIAHAFYLEWFRLPVGHALDLPYLPGHAASDAG